MCLICSEVSPLRYTTGTLVSRPSPLFPSLIVRSTGRHSSSHMQELRSAKDNDEDPDARLENEDDGNPSMAAIKAGGIGSPGPFEEEPPGSFEEEPPVPWVRSVRKSGAGAGEGVNKFERSYLLINLREGRINACEGIYELDYGTTAVVGCTEL